VLDPTSHHLDIGRRIATRDLDLEMTELRPDREQVDALGNSRPPIHGERPTLFVAMG
jgi:hypothetical protein